MAERSEAPITLFVLHWNRPEECCEAVRAFLAQKPSMRVVIVDNDSVPENYERVRRELFDRAEFVRLATNRGWGAALNVVLGSWLETGTGSYCFVSAHDAAPHEHCLDLLLRAAEAD